MKKLVFILSVLFLMTGTADVQAQWLKKVGQKAVDRAKDRAKNKVERKVENAVDKTVDGVFEEAEDAVTGKNRKEGDPATGNKGNDEIEEASDGATQNVEQKALSAEMTYAKSDFVAGDTIIFEDNLSGEQMGEFPSQWELIRGNAEIAMVNGEKVINMLGQDSWIEPLMRTPKNYLGDKFTLEFDFLIPEKAKQNGSFELDFMGPQDYRDRDVFTVTWSWYLYNQNELNLSYGWRKADGSRGNGGERVKVKENEWHHLALSFNKRAMKVYINGRRVANVPNVGFPPGWVTFWTGGGTTGHDKFIKNIRIAQGAVPLYDRMLTDGKFITYGITFDVGKSVIKPESMGEINRIVKLMTENPDLNFSVEGHTDSTGNAASNQTLSEARSKAIVEKLTEMGIAADRLTAVGKGQTSPIADNATDEGRAKNRRVEFVKI